MFAKRLISRFIFISILFTALFFSNLETTPVYAAGITVDTDVDESTTNGLCSLREAITNADNNSATYPDCATGSGTDTITFAGNYTITLAGVSLGPITSEIIITGNGVVNTIIQANASPNTATDRVFHVGSTGNLTLDGLTVRHGRCNGRCTLPFQSMGGGILNDGGILTVTNSTLSGNSAYEEISISEGGGAIMNWDGTLTITNSTLSGNSASIKGGAILNWYGTPTIINSTLTGNSAAEGGGVYNFYGNLTVTNSTLSGNSAVDSGGGIYNAFNGSLSVSNSTISGNSATYNGGGIYNSGTASMIINRSTLFGNSAGTGGALYNDGYMWLANATISGNEAFDYGGGIYSDGSAWIHNSTIVFNILVEGTNSGAGGIDGDVALYNTLLAGNIRAISSEYRDCSGTMHLFGMNRFWAPTCNFADNISAWDYFEPLETLGPLQDNGGPTWTHALFAGNNAIDAGDNALCASWPINNLDQRGAARPQGSRCDIGAYEAGGIRVIIGNAELSAHALAPMESTRVSLPGVNNGPVQLVNRNGQSLIAAERLIYKVNGVPTSFTEMMGLPDGQLSSTYWLPWYNNVDLDTQLRFGNVSGSTATVRVYIGGTEMTTGCTSTPSLPYPYVLGNGASIRVSCAGVNNGPVKIQGTGNIVAAERLIYKVNGIPTSFTEMMGLPNNFLDTSYWFPWYNNVDLDTQLRFGNVSGSTATVRIFIGGVEMTSGCTSTPNLPYPYVLGNGASIRVSCAGVNNGPVKIVSNQNVVAAERVIYKVNGISTSFSEMMGLPDTLRDTSYWFPWYNNVDLDTQLRFGVP